MTLKDLEIGQSACISKVGGNGELRQHFLDMGVIPGTVITKIKTAPMGDPVEFDVSGYEPSYYYSKLSDLKVEMLEKASKDARQRAKAMLKATHNSVGKVQSVQMGVFQITPEDSTSVSDMGISDTSTIKKKVTSVANVTFRIK